MEEKFESTNSEEIYTLNIPERNIFYFASTVEGKKQKDALAYINENNEAIENILRSMPPKKAEKILKQIQAIQQSSATQLNESPDDSAKTETKKIETEEAQTQKNNPVQKFTSPILFQVNPSTAKTPEGYLDMVYSVAEGPFFRTSLWDFPIVVDTRRVSPRGQVHNGKVTLSSNMSSITEAAKVLVHELGHMVDVYMIRGSRNVADPSLSYYAISWSEPTVMRSSASSRDFISGYAATNQYEDFAEAFTFYVFHNIEFEQRALDNPVLQKKYDFLHDEIFGEIFTGTAYEKNVIPSSFWDVTKIVLNTSNLKEIFASLSKIIPLI